jgi:hypothetical protein
VSGYREQVREAIEATAITSPTTYTWFGKAAPRLPRAVRRALTDETARGYLVHTLQSRLYGDFYIRGSAVATRSERHASVSERGTFVAALSSANVASGAQESGWEVLRHAEGHVVVRREGLELWVRPEECLGLDGSVPPPGAEVGLRMPKELLGVSPGYYVASGSQEFTRKRPFCLWRLYWNLTARGAVPFVRAATAALEGAVPYRLKVLQDPHSFTRCDAGVLYFEAGDRVAVAAAARRIQQEVRRHLKPSTPVLTKRLDPGIGFAEDPGDDQSFGQQRCRLLADGIVSAHERAARSVDERLEVVSERLAANGVRLEHPYASPGPGLERALAFTGGT